MFLGKSNPWKNQLDYWKLENPTNSKLEQEAHGPRFAHLSDIATADMQMLCNIFPILSSQLMKISSFDVCVEVLRPSQPNGVMSSTVSLPDHTFTGQA